MDAEQQGSASSAASLPELRKELEPDLWSCFIGRKRGRLVTIAEPLVFLLLSLKIGPTCYFPIGPTVYVLLLPLMSDFPSRPVRKIAYTPKPTTIIEKYLGTSDSKFFFFAYWIFLPCIERLKFNCVYNALIYRSERFNASFLKQLILPRYHEVPSLGELTVQVCPDAFRWGNSQGGLRSARFCQALCSSDASHTGLQNRKGSFGCGAGGLHSGAVPLAQPASTYLYRIHLFSFPFPSEVMSQLVSSSWLSLRSQYLLPLLASCNL